MAPDTDRPRVIDLRSSALARTLRRPAERPEGSRRTASSRGRANRAGQVLTEVIDGLTQGVARTIDGSVPQETGEGISGIYSTSGSG